MWLPRTQQSDYHKCQSKDRCFHHKFTTMTHSECSCYHKCITQASYVGHGVAIGMVRKHTEESTSYGINTEFRSIVFGANSESISFIFVLCFINILEVLHEIFRGYGVSCVIYPLEWHLLIYLSIALRSCIPVRATHIPAQKMILGHNQSGHQKIVPHTWGDNVPRRRGGINLI